MSPGASFFFTFKEAAQPENNGREAFRYPFAFFEKLGKESGLAVEDVSDQYLHPRGQRMAVARRHGGAG